jgi:hypothetical protein
VTTVAPHGSDSMRSIPLITANPYPAASSKEEATAGGQRRGKPSAALGGMAP